MRNIPENIIDNIITRVSKEVLDKSNEIHESLKEECSNPLVALCIVQALQSSLLKATVDILDDAFPEDAKIGQNGAVKLYLEVLEPIISNHIRKVTAAMSVAEFIKKSSENN